MLCLRLCLHDLPTPVSKTRLSPPPRENNLSLHPRENHISLPPRENHISLTPRGNPLSPEPREEQRREGHTTCSPNMVGYRQRWLQENRTWLYLSCLSPIYLNGPGECECNILTPPKNPHIVPKCTSDGAVIFDHHSRGTVCHERCFTVEVFPHFYWRSIFTCLLMVLEVHVACCHIGM